MKTPLRLIRERNNKTILDVALAIGIDQGGLSRIERGKQTPTKDVAEKLANYFSGEINEIHILYPERFAHKNS